MGFGGFSDDKSWRVLCLKFEVQLFRSRFVIDIGVTFSFLLSDILVFLLLFFNLF